MRDKAPASDADHTPPRPVQPDGRLHGVIVACRRDDGRWLMIRRGRDVSAAPLKICFPGGAVNVGEDYADAARREFREEMGVDVRLIQRVWHHKFDDRPLTLIGWLGELLDDDLQIDPAEVDQAMWLTGAEAANHPDVLIKTDAFIAALESTNCGR